MNRNQKFLVVSLCFSLLIVGIALIWKYHPTKNKSAVDAYSATATATTTKVHRDLIWGVSVNPSPNAQQNEQTLDKVVSFVKDLKLNIVRLTFPDWTTPDPYISMDAPVKKLTDAGVDILLVFQPSKSYTDMQDPYQEGYDQAYKLAARYPQVKYFQLGNEPGNLALKPSHSGAADDSYDPDKYQAVMKYLKGASDGVTKGNSRAKKVVTGNWLGGRFIEKIIADQVNFDIVGWDWFNEEKNDITVTQADEFKVPILTRLAATGKTVWLTEIGISGDNEIKQADFLNNFINKIFTQPMVKGIFVGVLADQIHLINTPGAKDGLVNLTKQSDGSYAIGPVKPAYNTYKQIIEDSQ